MNQGKTVLVTGAAGQDGLLLSKLMSDRGENVIGVVRSPQQAELLKKYAPSARSIQTDITEKNWADKVLLDFDVDTVVNLAATSSVAESWANPALTFEVNTLAVAGLLDSVRHYTEKVKVVRFYQASSSEMYGPISGPPASEIFPLKPGSPYAVSKVASHELCLSFRQAYGLDIRTGILFNHESPLRAPRFLTRKISQSVAKIANNSLDKIMLGDLNIRRDWGYAPDFAKAIYAILQSETAGDYVVATGVLHSIRDILDFAFAHIGIEDWSPYVQSSSDFIRPIEHAAFAGDSSKIKSELGWTPSKDLKSIIHEMVDFDIELLRNPVMPSEWQPWTNA